MSITIKDLAQLCDTTIEGGDPLQSIHAVNDIIAAQVGEVTQLTQMRYRHHLEHSKASACFIGQDIDTPHIPKNIALLRCADPEMAFITAVKFLHPQASHPRTISPQAILADNVRLEKNCYVGPFAVICEQTQIGENSDIFAGVYIGKQVKIGKNCRLYPYAVIYDGVEIADNVIIHSGAVIGADGFGYKFRHGAHLKVPQVGNVVIAENVEIGANTCIDRGALNGTYIGKGSKIDNLVQIGHNNKIGQHVIVCGQTGISGSCDIGDYAILAGSAGIADHVNIGQGAVVMARAGVANDIPAKTQVFGSPAKDKRLAYREQIALSQLPDLLKTIKQLEARITQLENSNEIKEHEQ